MKQEKMPPATKKRPFMATQPATSITPPNLRAAPNRSIAIKSAPPASFPGSKPPSSLSTSSQQLQMPNNMLRPPTNNRMPVPGGTANIASDMMKMQHALFLQMQQRRYAAQRNGNAVNAAGRPSSSATMLSSNRTPAKPYARTPPAPRSVTLAWPPPPLTMRPKAKPHTVRCRSRSIRLHLPPYRPRHRAPRAPPPRPVLVFVLVFISNL